MVHYYSKTKQVAMVPTNNNNFMHILSMHYLTLKSICGSIADPADLNAGTMWPRVLLPAKSGSHRTRGSAAAIPSRVRRCIELAGR